MKSLFNKKFVHSVVSGPDAAFIVEDKLTAASDAEIEVSATPGCPATADCISYNATQRLLLVRGDAWITTTTTPVITTQSQISTSTGHVKVIGKLGVEVSIACAPSPTLSLHSLPFAGAALRLSQAGDAELIALDQCRTTSTLQHPDTFTAAAVIDGHPFIVLGCTSGSLRIASLLGATGASWKPGSAVGAARLAPYGVPAAKLGLQSAVTALAAHCSVEGVVLIAAGASQGVAVWNARCVLDIPWENECGKFVDFECCGNNCSNLCHTSVPAQHGGAVDAGHHNKHCWRRHLSSVAPT